VPITPLLLTFRRLWLLLDKLVMNVDRVGNTSGASIPLALDELNRQGKLKEGDLLLQDAFGGGFAWGSVLLIM
jgi:3-oxoacyl-[acyl-carrier-protein] synthase III